MKGDVTSRIFVLASLESCYRKVMPTYICPGLYAFIEQQQLECHSHDIDSCYFLRLQMEKLQDMQEIEGLPEEARVICREVVTDTQKKFDELFWDSWEFRPEPVRRTRYHPRVWAEKAGELGDRLKFAAEIFKHGDYF